MTFRVGMKVVCVADDFASSWEIIKNRPQRGEVYTIRAITTCIFGKHPETLCVLLHEVRNRKRLWEGERSAFECPFAVWRFRPVQERKTDISIFTHMLNPSKIGADA